MRIVFFLGGMGGGGAERVISILSRDYAERGWSTDICALLLYKSDYELHNTTRFLDFTGHTDSRMKRVPYWMRQIRNYVKTEKPDVIVSFFASVSALVMPSCIGLNIPNVVSERSDPRYDGRHLPVRILVDLFYTKAKKVVFQTEAVKKRFRKKIQDLGVVIPNPITVTAHASHNPQKKIVTANRIVSGKNHKLLIDAFHILHEIKPDYHLWIYGDGDLKDKLVKYVDDLQLSKFIHFPGRYADIHEQMRDAKMFVLSSDYEGLSNSLLEAMMMGLPCITTDSFDTSGIIENEKNGLIVPKQNINELKSAMLRIIDDENLALKLAKNARETSKKFEKNKVLKMWRNVIES